MGAEIPINHPRNRAKLRAPRHRGGPRSEASAYGSYTTNPPISGDFRLFDRLGVSFFAFVLLFFPKFPVPFAALNITLFYV